MERDTHDAADDAHPVAGPASRGAGAGAGRDAEYLTSAAAQLSRSAQHLAGAEPPEDDPWWDGISTHRGEAIYLDPDGRPMTPRAWAHLFQDYPARELASTAIGDRTVVTVWSGVNQRLLGSQGTGIFASIVRTSDGHYLSASEIETDTRDDALAAHQRLVHQHPNQAVETSPDVPVDAPDRD